MTELGRPQDRDDPDRRHHGAQSARAEPKSSREIVDEHRASSGSSGRSPSAARRTRRRCTTTSSAVRDGWRRSSSGRARDPGHRDRRDPRRTACVMSLVENIARRQHRAIDLLHEIGRPRTSAATASEIAEKTGLIHRLGHSVVTLLERASIGCFGGRSRAHADHRCDRDRDELRASRSRPPCSRPTRTASSKGEVVRSASLLDWRTASGQGLQGSRARQQAATAPLSPTH